MWSFLEARTDVKASEKHGSELPVMPVEISYTAGLGSGPLCPISKSADISALPLAAQCIPESCCHPGERLLFSL